MMRFRDALLSRGQILAGWLIVPVVAAMAAWTVIRAIRDLRRSDIIVVYENGGFGHLATVPDALRRLYPDRAVTLLFGAHPGRHNWYVSRLWQTPRVHLLPFGLALDRRGRFPGLMVPLPLQVRSCAWLAAALKRLWPAKMIVDSAHEFQRLLRRQVSGRDDFADELLDNWPSYYLRLMNHRPAPPVRLPPELASRARAELERVRDSPGRPKSGLCCLYLRAKGARIDINSGVRSGSDISEYVPAIRFLVSAGYQCVLIGDRRLPDALTREFGGWLVDAHRLEPDPWLMSLFAATEADLFIGESGGGSWLPGVNGVPTLIVNNFPYYQTRYRATVFFKWWIDAAGQPVEPRRAFSELARSYLLDGCTVRSNSGLEIEAAVRDFVAGHRQDSPYGASIEEIAGPGADSWFADAEARVSPAWLRLAAPEAASDGEISRAQAL
jgi:putative glycosyltransferase (TIGR04372 family)